MLDLKNHQRSMEMKSWREESAVVQWVSESVEFRDRERGHGPQIECFAVYTITVSHISSDRCLSHHVCQSLYIYIFEQ